MRERYRFLASLSQLLQMKPREGVEIFLQKFKRRNSSASMIPYEQPCFILKNCTGLYSCLVDFLSKIFLNDRHVVSCSFVILTPFALPSEYSLTHKVDLMSDTTRIRCECSPRVKQHFQRELGPIMSNSYPISPKCGLERDTTVLPCRMG